MPGRKTYVAPASNTKGPEAVPGWRDPERAAQNWRDCARLLRRYAVAVLCLAMAFLWFTGYAMGLLDAGADSPPAATRNERNPK
ncbi:MAG: hypothetical protein CMG88_03665 [Marinobacter sp.]|nr:hypothetical protein [Marinobacter sp.]